MKLDISVVTLFQELYAPFLSTSLIKRAQEQDLVSCSVSSLFDFVAPKVRVDAPVAGHGSGMLLKPEVMEKAIEHNERERGPAYKIFFSPHGETLDQDLLKEIYKQVQERNGHLMVLPARYEGIDARVESFYADKIVSVGDFVLMGGDVPAMMLLEGLLRLVPGVVGRQESVVCDSFESALVDYPHYTEPETWKGMSVPPVVKSGNHKELRQWRLEQAARRTVRHHFDWMRGHKLAAEEEKVVMDVVPPHYVVLMHSDVRLPDDRVGTTSVTSLDIHDVARSVATYGLAGYYLVTPLEDQQKIVRKLLSFWDSEVGKEYNKHRYEALQRVFLNDTLAAVIADVRHREGKEPLLVATSARVNEYREHHGAITYNDQGLVWSHDRPVIFILGTGLGLSHDILKQSDFMVPPLYGLSPFNHLSVRSAAAVIFDRWLGMNPKKSFFVSNE
jgi:tRNA (guanine37-N1)-methyltransferase